MQAERRWGKEDCRREFRRTAPWTDAAQKCLLARPRLIPSPETTGTSAKRPNAIWHLPAPDVSAVAEKQQVAYYQ